MTTAAPDERLVTQRERAYHSLRRLLILQQIPEGARLSEPEWASRLEVNRTALREAFARLEAEGLIERGARAGYIVPELTDADVRDILKVRAILERGAIDILVARGSADLSPMVAACDELESLLAKDYLLGASEADRRFHEALVDLAGNRRLSMLYHRAPLPMIHRRVIATDRWREECARTLREHRSIISSIEAGLAEQARQILEEHLSERYLLPLPTH